MNLQSGTKSNDEILFIKTKLKSLTQISFDEKYIKIFYLPLLQSIRNKRNIMIAGSQGSGKSSLAHLISAYLKKYYSKNSVVISLDDFYLSKNSRVNTIEGTKIIPPPTPNKPAIIPEEIPPIAIGTIKLTNVNISI